MVVTADISMWNAIVANGGTPSAWNTILCPHALGQLLPLCRKNSFHLSSPRPNSSIGNRLGLFVLPVLPLQLLESPRFIDVHLAELFIQPVETYLRDVFLPAQIHHALFTTIRLSKDTDFVFRHISHAFHSSGPFVRTSNHNG